MSEDTTRNLPGGDLGEVLSILRSIDTRLTNVENRLTALEDKVEHRLYDTRPIWEQVLVRLTAVEERLTNVEGELTKLGARVKKVEDEVFMLRRRFRDWSSDIGKLEEKHEDLEERFEEFKSERSK
jgi:chromosome segregation ATPase